MSDDLKKRGKPDQNRINRHEEWEVEWWCKELGCTRTQLFDCIDQVGVMAANVRPCIAKKLGRR